MSAKVYIGLGFVLIAALLLWVVFMKPQPLEWYKTYRTSVPSWYKNKHHPYDFTLFREWIGPQSKSVESSWEKYFKTINGKGHTLVFVGGGLMPTSKEASSLKSFVEAGNTVFISAEAVGYELTDTLLGHTCAAFDQWQTEYLSDVSLTLVHPSFKGKSFDLPIVNKYGENEASDYTGFSAEWFCGGESVVNLYDSTESEEEDTYYNEMDEAAANILTPDSMLTAITPLGMTNDSSFYNFIRFPIGKGWVYLHSTPSAFTNYPLTEGDGMAYLAATMEHLPKGQQLHTDFLHQVSVHQVSIHNSEKYHNKAQNRFSRNKSPLSYVFEQPALRWAWYTLLGTGILFLLFGGKRRQRIIPVLPIKQNTSLAFVETIGRLSFKQGNHRNLALQQLRLFMIFVRDRYHLSTQNLDDHFVQQLTYRSGVPKAQIEHIMLLNKNLASGNFLSENMLIQLYKVIDHFYKNCK